MPGRRRLLKWLLLLAYGGSIVLANWLIAHVGTVTLPDGMHLAPVGFGLLAPSGAYAAGFTFVARDLLQRVAGKRWGLGAIAGGTVISVLVSPELALASGTSFLFSELVEFSVYTPLQRDHFVLAVFLSGVVGSIVDSVIFLSIAGIPLTTALAGLLLAKVWVQLLATPVAGWLRTRMPQAANPEPRA
ncbi:MAG TPA: VUT family protein [Longimicrobiaceae bacterium]|nr:VUT family protein [Longimicrobiaceae bacterium]